MEGLGEKVLSGNNGQSLKSQENKWKKKRVNIAKNVALGALELGAVVGVTYGGYKIHRHIQATNQKAAAEEAAAAEVAKRVAQQGAEKAVAAVVRALMANKTKK